MAVGGHSAMAKPQPIAQPPPRDATVQPGMIPTMSPPSSKSELKSWWKRFGRKPDADDENAIASPGIFGVPLAESIRYANVAISFSDSISGESKLYGYVPIVVAKCGVYLKEKAVDVEGIFRLSGSAKRIKDLQTIFDSPDRYGKGLDWTGYTVHDAANILRRYLNQLPEPIVPLDFYERFREPLRMYQARAGVGKHAQGMESQEHGQVVAAYKQLITELPALNRQLLLYILDLLAVFASKSDVNRMTAQNLAAIFQPGILSHPQHDMAPNEYLLSQDVLIFLIENQDNFLFGMPGTGINQAEQEAVTPKSSVRRANSVNSAGGSFRLRKAGSKSSRDSKHRGSPGVSTPGTPGSPGPMTEGSRTVSGSLARSNTVPTNHSPALTGHRFQPRTPDFPNAGAINAPATIPGSPSKEVLPPPPTDGIPETVVPPPPPTTADTSRHPRSTESVDTTQLNFARLQPPLQSTPLTQDSSANVPANVQSRSRERKTPNFFPKSPLFGPSDAQKANGEQRQPRKLQKRRIPGSANESAHSSEASFQAADDAVFQQAPLRTPINLDDTSNPFDSRASASSHTAAIPIQSQYTSPSANRRLMPPSSPTTSLHSKTSVTDASDFEALDDSAVREEKPRHRFRLSDLGRSKEPLAPPPSMGQLAGARTSNTSLGSNRPRKSYTGDSQQTQTGDSFHTAQSSTVQASSRESGDPFKGQTEEPRKEGFLTKWKAKLTQAKDERDAEKRAKSPPRLQPGESGSRASLSAFAHEHFSPRGRSMDMNRQRDNSLQGGLDRPVAAISQPPMPSTSNVVQPPSVALASTSASVTEPTSFVRSQPTPLVMAPPSPGPEYVVDHASHPVETTITNDSPIRTSAPNTSTERDAPVETQTAAVHATAEQNAELRLPGQSEKVEMRSLNTSQSEGGQSRALDSTKTTTLSATAPIVQPRDIGSLEQAPVPRQGNEGVESERAGAHRNDVNDPSDNVASGGDNPPLPHAV